MKTAKQLLKKKRFIKAEMDRKFPQSLSDELWQKAETRLDGILKKYEALSGGVRTHTDHYIFPAAAIYLTLCNATTRERAYAVIENTAIEHSSEVGRKLARLMKLPGMKRFFVWVWHPMVKKLFGEDSGFRNVFYPKKKGEYRMDVTACPYCRYFTELGCPELTKIFCANDERCYGNLPGLAFRRTGTLGTGADRCDFCLKIISEKSVITDERRPV
ncbi:MAG: L-2-amino-thiazoline-4-carboxylic acid hydrolase [Clostridia bacterium]|nr:L-2-amino-thiazoline-4-carboxylic acid hydrolase [Clostridia bacterium]